MELSELVNYANEKYHVQEQHKWADFPGFSVLCHPQTGKWVALLMRQWDTQTGTEIERCDLKCGNDSLSHFRQAYLSQPIRMHGNKWIGIAFDEHTERSIVLQLFDQAITFGEQHGCTVVLGSELIAGEDIYRDTALPFVRSGYQAAKEKVPERLRKMRRLFEYGRESVETRAKNFYRQAVLMQDYVDNEPWKGDFFRYFPTYHDLTAQQLRGYFTWRTQVRQGEFRPIAASAAYIYIYELLNGVGAASPEDSLKKLKIFETGYLDSGFGDKRMRHNLRRWMLEFAVLNEFPQETARQAADPEMIENDEALFILRMSENRSDDEVFSALCRFGGKRIAESPVFKNDLEKGKRLLSKAWRTASSYCRKGKDLFTLCFGEQKIRQWYPLSNAVYYERSKPKDREYPLNDCRRYSCRNGIWQVKAYEKLSFDRAEFQGFLHETDAKLRRYLKTGHYLKENPACEWAVPFIDAAIEADKKSILEAVRPMITIDLSDLERIRKEAIAIRDSLLIEEELQESTEVKDPAKTTAVQAQSALPLDPVQIQILCALLQGGDISEIISSNHLMPSIVADLINAALFDEIGDTVLTCENDRISLVEDYIEELEQLLGENSNGCV